MKRYCHLFSVFVLLFFNLCMGRAHPNSPDLSAQPTILVNGSVHDDSRPIQGVTVKEQGTDNVTVTSANGTFEIRVATKQSVLQFSAVGYESIAVVVGDQANIQVTLVPVAHQLDDVVVTALGISREKKALGYSIEEVDGKELNRVAQENVLNALSGKVAGVTINQTGAAGSSVSMIIRGATSLSSDNQPLFVIDGVPIANSLNNVAQVGSDNRVDYGNAIAGLNPDDIENVTVLKGPSAAALYGSRAGNGVVLITTKSGKGLDKPTVNFSSNTVIDKPYRFLKWQTKYASGVFPAIPIGLTGNMFTDPLGLSDPRFNPNQVIIDEASAGSGGPMLDQGYLAVQWNSQLDEDGNPIALPLVSHPDNVKNFVQSGLTSTNSISIANNSDLFNYRVSYANMSNRGIIPNSDLFRNTLNLNSMFKLTDRFSLTSNVDLSRNNSNNRPAGERGANPLEWAYKMSPHINILDFRDYWEPGQEGLQQRTQYNGEFNNPYFLAYEVNNSFVRDRIYGNIKADWQITDDLSLMIRYGLDMFNEQRETKIANSYQQDPGGVYGLTNIKHFESNADFLLTYKKRLTDFDFSVSAGGNVRRNSGSNSRNATKNGTGLIVPGVYTIGNILPANLDYGSYVFKRGINSIYGMATVGFKDMVYLDVTGRTDWSSTLPDASSYFYPSASLSLLAHEMLGIATPSVNMIKLRGGYAQVGNDASPYQLFNVLANAGTWGDIPRLANSGTLLNPFLKPERATSYEGGIDVSLFQNRLDFTATYYVVDNENQIFTTALAPSTGYTSKNINAGLLRSRGIELSLGGSPVRNDHFRWDVNVNFTRNRTRVMELADEMPYFTYWEDAKGGAYTFVGEDVGDIYGPRIRVVEDQSSPYYGYPLLEVGEDGAKWVAEDAIATRNKIGNFNPKFIMGMMNTISYKNWTLNFTLDWRNGGQFVSQTYRYGTEDGKSAIQFDKFINPGGLSGRELRDYLVANADEIIKSGKYYRVGWPSPEQPSYPVIISGYNLPYGGLFAPGVYASGWDSDGNPTGYIENLGENMLGADPSNPNATIPMLYAVSNPWDFMDYSMFPASYLKLREVSLTFDLPSKLVRPLRMQGASLSVYSRNIMLWTAAKINIDPENAYQPTADAQGGIQFKQGIERYNVTPWTIPFGFKLNVTF